MLLSVIIVSYQVKYFLEQCLFSVEKALREIDGGTEIIVVDNHSMDGTLEYLQPRFSGVEFIALPDNQGFARANNRGLEKAKGRYILFLNPDTILPEDACRICLSFMASTPGIGAAGVRMIDGSGRFLKESRRGFPSAWVAFCKFSGLTALFPGSRWLAGYYLGHLPEKQTHPAPILSGACMWVDRAALDRTGGFDEQFFMYAEDIDLSHRIGQAGFTNYYIADTTILHFKGESTRKDAQYIKSFYTAMVRFRRKYSKGPFSRLFDRLLEIAVRIKVAIASTPPEEAPLQYDIILSEGEHLSFKEIITTLQESGGKTVLIHAAGSSSAVGSPSSQHRGIAIEYDPAVEVTR
ncbi:MAG: glycosyltransferase family 2 protein [Chitinophagaceae bacterium]|nr:glycosyltransferase family 2 protein [Chitinophagaceae bacterium]